ncbi:MAG: efflux RND transporter periplasmic adaptor subunit, partial [Mucinivorans sp.]
MKIITALCGALLLCGCGRNSNVESTDKEISIENDVITVNPLSVVQSKIKTIKVEPSAYQAQFSTSGMVKAIPISYAEIATPFAGRIVRSFVRLGQSVAVGSPLFEISSPDFFETMKSYFAAKKEMEQAERSLVREKDLLLNHVGVAKDVEQAQVSYELQKQDYENAKSALKVFQVDPETMSLGQPLIVRSPIAGKVVANNIILGQYVKEESEPLSVVADLSRVWVVAHVKEKDIRLIEKLQEVEIRLSASPEEPLKGTIYHISDMLDEATRSVEVIVECDNHAGKMKPFMYGTVILTDAKTEALLIPTTAILQQEQSNYVLLKVGQHQFKRVPIEVNSTMGESSVVTSGVKVGDEIVSEG